MVTLTRAPSGRWIRPPGRWVDWLNWNEGLVGWAKIRAQVDARAPIGAAEPWPIFRKTTHFS